MRLNRLHFEVKGPMLEQNVSEVISEGDLLQLVLFQLNGDNF